MPFLTAENADYADGRGSVAFVSVHRSMRMPGCLFIPTRPSASISASVLSGPKSVASNLGKVSDLNERCSSRKSSPETSPKDFRLPWERRRLGQCRIIFANCIANPIICRHVGRLSRADTARSAEKGFALDPGGISLPGRSPFTVAFHALALRLWRAGAT